MPRIRKRSKSVAEVRRYRKLDEEKTKHELEFSVNFEEKRNITKTKKKKQLVAENMYLDSGKHRVEKEMKDKEHDLKLMKFENSKLSDDLKAVKEELSKLKLSTDNERISLWNDIRKGMTEKDKVKSDFENERKALEKKLKISKEENDILKLKLDNERQRLEDVAQSVKIQLSKQAKEFAEEKEKIEGEKRQMTKDLTEERKQNWENFLKVSTIIQNSRGAMLLKGSFKHVQMGASNIISDEVASQWQELIDKLSLSVDEQMAKRQELETMISKNKIMLKEMQDSINKIADNLKKSRSKLSKEDRELLIFLTADRSDEHVITEGIKQFSQVRKDKKNLPLAVDAMIERLLNKLGSITCGKFVQILEGRKHTLNKEMVPDDTDQTEVKQFSIKSEPENPLQQFDNDIPLDKCLCVEILSNWLNFSDENDHLNLLGKLKAYESKLSAELIIKYENEFRSINVSSDIKEYNRRQKIKANMKDLTDHHQVCLMPFHSLCIN
ncbi:uncharacterized protein LOC132719633 [Ruditapes philippinarum]|uniref:uncharacterized protein LOC132719633 n=1 Tax=Ruditapes philippinarum TaxID=129788 RepID=UPI00295C38A2|nr:uncharacterized protein LOC132719633 [Ruditapes philippinarum]